MDVKHSVGYNSHKLISFTANADNLHGIATHYNYALTYIKWGEKLNEKYELCSVHLQIQSHMTSFTHTYLQASIYYVILIVLSF